MTLVTIAPSFSNLPAYYSKNVKSLRDQSIPWGADTLWAIKAQFPCRPSSSDSSQCRASQISQSAGPVVARLIMLSGSGGVRISASQLPRLHRMCYGRDLSTSDFITSGSTVPVMTVAKRLSGVSPESRRYREWTRIHPSSIKILSAPERQVPSGVKKMLSGLGAVLPNIANTVRQK